MKQPKKIHYDETVFINTKEQWKGILDKKTYDKLSSKLGNIRSLMLNYQKEDFWNFYKKIGIVKTTQKRTAALQKSLPKNLRSSLSEIQKIQSKMFGRCQSYFSQEAKEAENPVIGSQ